MVQIGASFSNFSPLPLLPFFVMYVLEADVEAVCVNMCLVSWLQIPEGHPMGCQHGMASQLLRRDHPTIIPAS